LKHFHNISSCFSSALDKFNLNRGASILVALSGGPDSTALIALINRERRRRDIYLAAAHFNHKLRPEADEEERAVQTLCEKLSIPLEIGIGRVEEYSRRTGKSIHTAARDLRHHFLAAAARSWAASNQSPEPIIALGHHEDDGLETMLMRLFGGSGVEGLAWMAPDARSPADSGVRLVRPVLGFTREELRRFCECEGLEFADDQTNEDVKYPRNRVRRELIPQIERLFGSSARRGLRRSGELLAEAASLFGIMSDEAYEKCMVEEKVGEVILDYLAFSSYNTLIQSDMLQRGARVAAGGSARISLERCRAALQTAAKSARLTQMGEGVCAQRWRNALYIYHNPSDWKARVLDIDSRIEIRGFGVISLELLDAGSVQFRLHQEFCIWTPHILRRPARCCVLFAPATQCALWAPIMLAECATCCVTPAFRRTGAAIP